MGLKGFSYGLTGLALGCGLLAAGRLPSAGSGQPLLLVARLLVAGAAVALLAAVVAVQQADRRPLWASLVVLAAYAVVLLGGLWMLAGLAGLE